jgi:hypothetical protein
MIFPRKTYKLANGCMTCAKLRPRGQREVTPRKYQDRKWGLTFEKKPWRASRLAYCLNVAPISSHPSGNDEFVLHTCDNEWCINPAHLYLGTIKQNTKDKFERHPTIHAIMSEGSKRAWKNRSKELRAKSLAKLYGQKGQPSYIRDQESRQRSANSRRANWAQLTPEQYAERCYNISKGKLQKKVSQ